MGTHFGRCRLCGRSGELSFEHIPPRSAFNDQPQKIPTLLDVISARAYTQFQRGTGQYSLCRNCNQRTGDWYVTAYREWASQAMSLLSVVTPGSQVLVPFPIRPLAVIKQICCMALAMSHEASIEVSFYEDLRRFVAQPTLSAHISRVAVFCYFCRTGSRFTQQAGVMRADLGLKTFVYAEIAFPPIGYCIVDPFRNGNALPTYYGLCDISHFSSYPYHLLTTEYLAPTVLDAIGPCALDCRSRAELESAGAGQWTM